MFDFLKKQFYLTPLFIFFLLQETETQDFERVSVDTTTLWITLGICIPLIILIIAGFWKVFEKAGQPGWASIIPIYNYIVLLRIAGKPWWWLFLLMIPLVNIYFLFVVSIDVARNFGKDTGFGVGLALLGFIFYPILGFGSARYMPHQQYQPQPQYGGYR